MTLEETIRRIRSVWQSTTAKPTEFLIILREDYRETVMEQGIVLPLLLQVLI